MTSGIIEISFTSLVFGICALLVTVIFGVAKYYLATVKESIQALRVKFEEDKKTHKENLDKDLIIFRNELEKKIEGKVEESRKSILRHFEENSKTNNKMMSSLISRLDRMNPKLLEKIIIEDFE